MKENEDTSTKKSVARSKSSRYDTIFQGISATIPKRNLRHSWTYKPDNSKPNIYIGTYDDGDIKVKQSGIVKAQKQFFESKPLKPNDLVTPSKPEPNSQILIPYRVKRFRDNIGPAPRRTRKTLSDFPQWKDTIIPEEVISGHPERNEIIRRHTVGVTKEDVKEALKSNAPVTSASLKRSECGRVVLSSGTAPVQNSFQDRDVKYHETGMGVPNESVPRVVGASVKYMHEIPEDFLDQLPESSVDPSPEEYRRKSNDWLNMRASRDALLQGRQDPVLNNGPKGEHSKENIPSIQRVRIKNVPTTRPSVPSDGQPPDIQKELADAGIYFRNPDEPTEEDFDKAIETLEASLISVESSPRETPVENESSLKKDVSVADKNKTIIRINGINIDKMEPQSSALENFNLIEEVLVSSNIELEPPKSSVEMKAFYRSQTCSPPFDSDSGHESGATSPCETSTPPPSPGITSEPKVSPQRSLSPNPGVISTNDVTVVSCNESNSNSHFVVVAIDFGTTYSGYAFSFTQDPENIHVMKKWEGGDPGIINQKTPTIVLLNPDLQFHSMGFTARDTFHDLDPKEAKKWHYFDKFKMELHSNQVLTRDTTLEASNGRKVPAMDIFTYALQYFRIQALKELTEQTGTNVEDDDVRWVITVPAIWSYPAKQFMRDAAYKAGMSSPQKHEHLLIALEPEAAAIYCRRLRRNQLLPDIPPEQRIATLPSRKLTSCERHSIYIKDDYPSTPELERGTVYMVVDCGGGTVDITVHQMTNHKSGHLKEIHKATGGPYGSTGVDEEFKKLLNTVFGEQFMVDFKRERPVAYVDMMIAFESRKRNASPKKNTPLNIALPFSFIDLYKKMKGKEDQGKKVYETRFLWVVGIGGLMHVESAIKKHSNLGIKWSSQGMLRVEQETMKQLFMPTMEKIKEAIEITLTGSDIANLQYMFLVGGFCESELLQQYIRDSFGHRVSVIIPQGMGLAILRGAVQFGLDPSVVAVRRSRLTYGVGVLNKFREGEHPPEKKVVSSGEEWCADILDKFVEVDQSVAIGDVVTRSYTPAVESQKEVILHLYATDRETAKFVTDHGVRKVGTLHLTLSSLQETTLKRTNKSEYHIFPTKREITVHLRFGGTEVKASAVDHVTGQCVRANLEFLSL